MSHTINAWDPNVAVSDEIIASLYRSALCPMNQLIYRALDCVEECYAGASGNGNTILFIREELEMAIDFVERYDVENSNRPRNTADGLRVVMEEYGRTLVAGQGAPKTKQPELDFLNKCLKYVSAGGTRKDPQRDHVAISFL